MTDLTARVAHDHTARVAHDHTARVAHDHTARVVAAHERRLVGMDPWLRRTQPFPEPEVDDVVLTTDAGLALLRRERPDLDTLLATWGAAERHRLSVRVAEPDPDSAMGALLTQCRDQMLPQVGDDPDTQVDLMWPSRDTAMIQVFLHHGMAPGAVVAARPAGRSTPAAPPSVQVRGLEPDDLDAAAALWLEQIRWDTQFGSARERPSTLPAIRRELDDVLASYPSWAWVAGSAGRLDGLLVLEPPPRSGWIERLTSRDPVAYLSCLVVTAARRGGGVGAALVRRAHDALDAAGMDITLLHYAALNPLSAPFWHRCGYRPLWTAWQARPAQRLGVTR